MHNWFKCTVKYERVDGNGARKMVTEEYLVDALSYTEAESRFVENIRPMIPKEEFKVENIAKYKLAEIFEGDGDRYYKVTCDFLTIDGKGNEKRSPNSYLVKSSSIEKAIKAFNESMKGTMIDYMVTGCKEEKKMFDIFPYKA